MADQNDLNKPDLTSNYSSEVLQTIRGHIARLWTGDYSGMSNLIQGMRRWIPSTDGSIKLVSRNADGTESELFAFNPKSINGGIYVGSRGANSDFGNLAVGDDVLSSSSFTPGFVNSNNSAFGRWSLKSLTSGGRNTAIGSFAVNQTSSASKITAVGSQCLSSLPANTTNSSGIGCDASVTGSNQVQLGDSATNTYVYGTVQNRSDARDKADIRDTTLGLDFIMALRPVDYRWDMREFYIPELPVPPSENSSVEEVNAYKDALAQWKLKSKLNSIVRDGSKKRIRWHHGLIAQELKAVMDEIGIDFGGLQDHSVGGGEDVLSIGYDELIAPLIKSIQQLSQANQLLLTRIENLEASR